MGKELAAVDKEVLVEIVKFAQKREMKGAKGGWKEFLSAHDRKFGTSLSDPAKRSTDILTAFLETFDRDEDFQFFSNVMRRHKNLKIMERRARDSPESESPQQKLVRLTIGHPQYLEHYSFPSHNEDWIVIPLEEVSELANLNAMISVDCEMVLCEDGAEAVVKVCAVDHNMEVKLNKIVRPMKAIADYRTNITGICSKDLEGVTCSLVDVQNSLKDLLLHGTILVGHSLHNDLEALKIDHARVIDTTYIFKYVDIPNMKPSLNSLCKSVLATEVRKEGDPHDCLADAEAAMKLVLAKIEHGFDDPIAVEGKRVSEADLAKLLLHRIPVDVPSQDLLKLFSNNTTIDIESDSRIRGKTYSKFVVFKNLTEANEAFRDIEGQEEKDSGGRPQKLVTLWLRTGDTASFYIRKMAPDPLPDNHISSKKRNLLEDSEEPKRQRAVLHQCDHVKEIERLKQELCQREDEIFSLQKLLSTFMEKQ